MHTFQIAMLSFGLGILAVLGWNYLGMAHISSLPRDLSFLSGIGAAISLMAIADWTAEQHANR